MSDSPEVKSARGHVAHYERLIEQWIHRRDHGDSLPSAEILSEWIRHAAGELKQAEAALTRALKEETKPEPLG